MNTNDSALHIRLDRRTLLRSLLLATGGIITNSLSAEALALTPQQKNNQFPIDATPNEETTARAAAYLDSRWPELTEKIGKELIGEKMVCIDDSFSDEQIATTNARPVRGHVYTVRAIRIGWRGEDNNRDVSLRFHELVNTRLIFGREPGFWITRFEDYDSDADQADAGEQEEQGTEDSRSL